MYAAGPHIAAKACIHSELLQSAAGVSCFQFIVRTGGIKSVAQILGLIGGATLAVQTVVLGASLFQKASKPPPDLTTVKQGEAPSGTPGSPLQQGQVQIVTPNTPAPGARRSEAS